MLVLKVSIISQITLEYAEQSPRVLQDKKQSKVGRRGLAVLGCLAPAPPSGPGHVQSAQVPGPCRESETAYRGLCLVEDGPHQDGYPGTSNPAGDNGYAGPDWPLERTEWWWTLHSPTPKRLNSPSGVPSSHFPLTGSPCNPAQPCSPLIDLDDSRRITRRTADMAHPNCGLFKCGILVSPMQPRALCSTAASAMSGHFKSCSLPSFWPWAKTQVQVLSCLRILQTALRLWAPVQSLEEELTCLGRL